MYVYAVGSRGYLVFRGVSHSRSTKYTGACPRVSNMAGKILDATHGIGHF